MTKFVGPFAVSSILRVGNEKYPYYYMLPILLKRFIGDDLKIGYNPHGWIYKASVAGDGYRYLLPVFFQQILNPLFREEELLTEVFHINGKGDGAGELYSFLKVISLTNVK